MILGLLRERTTHLHEQIERTVDLPNRLQSVAAYTSLLAQFHGFYAPLEERLASVVGYDGMGLDLAARRKTHLLRGDLTALGMAEADINSLPRCCNLPAIAGVAESLGCLYVLEGATLGGQIVCRLAEKAIGVSAARGCSFFSSYGERVGRMWKQFCETLEGYAAATPGAHDRIVAAAIGTFTGLNQWVAEGGV